MATKNEKREKNLASNEGDMRAIRHLKESVIRGKHWYMALLESIKLWNSAEEDFEGRHFQYLIEGEAFDWLLLAERLCGEIMEMIPEQEMLDFLFFDKPPVELGKEEFKDIIGLPKYRAYLNYCYGVLVEEALLAAVTEEVRKDRRSIGALMDDGVNERVYKRIYGVTEEKLLSDFRREKGYSRRKNLSLGELKEFLYWLFKYRVKHTDGSRVASDTKKALVYLQNIMSLQSGR